VCTVDFPAFTTADVQVAFDDALRHPGAARVARLPKDVCTHPYAPGLDEAGTSAVLGAGANLIGGRLINQVPRVTAEPPVTAYAPAGGMTRRLSP
jgi:hypothetical protein